MTHAEDTMMLHPIGVVTSSLDDLATAPKQGNEGAPNAWLVLDTEVLDGCRDLQPGMDIVVLTWLDQARRDVLSVHPRGNPDAPLRGVFSTRSPSRPNPIGLHRVKIIGVDVNRFEVNDLEAVDGTPILDIKPILQPSDA